MNASILKTFLADQRKAKRLVSVKLGIPEDIRALEWATCYRELRRSYDACPFANIFRIHGYGLEIQVDDLYIDYDYSEQGLADGFDSWRIFAYITAGRFDNRGTDKHIVDRVKSWFDELIRLGQLEKLDNLYYLKNAPETSAEQNGEPKATLKVVTQMPLTELWRDDGFAATSRVRWLSADDITTLLRAGPVQFVVADVGASPRWILLGECYDFWKREARPHFAEPESRGYLDDFPDGYFYFASEWSNQDGTPIVVCERHH